MEAEVDVEAKTEAKTEAEADTVAETGAEAGAEAEAEAEAAAKIMCFVVFTTFRNNRICILKLYLNHTWLVVWQLLAAEHLLNL